MAIMAPTGATINTPPVNPARREVAPTSLPPTVEELIPAAIPNRRDTIGDAAV
jgi:hypothetical protein